MLFVATDNTSMTFPPGIAPGCLEIVSSKATLDAYIAKAEERPPSQECAPMQCTFCYCHLPHNTCRRFKAALRVVAQGAQVHVSPVVQVVSTEPLTESVRKRFSVYNVRGVVCYVRCTVHGSLSPVELSLFHTKSKTNRLGARPIWFGAICVTRAAL